MTISSNPIDLPIRRGARVERAVPANHQRRHIQFRRIVKQRPATIGRYAIDAPVVSGAKIDVPLAVDCRGPDVSLFGAEDLAEFWGRHQGAAIRDRDSMRLALQQFSAAAE